MQNAGQTLYSIFVATRHAKFNDGGSYLPWDHMFQHDQEAWNETADKFLAEAFKPTVMQQLPDTTAKNPKPEYPQGETVSFPETPGDPGPVGGESETSEIPVQEPVTETP